MIKLLPIMALILLAAGCANSAEVVDKVNVRVLITPAAQFREAVRQHRLNPRTAGFTTCTKYGCVIRMPPIISLQQRCYLIHELDHAARFQAGDKNWQGHPRRMC